MLLVKSMVLATPSIFLSARHLIVASWLVHNILKGSPHMPYVATVDKSIVAANKNRLAWIPIPAMIHFLMTSVILLVASSSKLKTILITSTSTINQSVKFAKFLMIFHMTHKGASSLKKVPYIMLLSNAIPANISPGRRRIYITFM